MYGPALLSRFPIVSAQSYWLTSSKEPRVLGIATLQIAPGRQLAVAYTHFNLVADERVTEAQEVLDHTAGLAHVLLMGDLNDVPNAPSVRTLTSRFSDAWVEAGNGPGYTDPSTTPDRRIDYILPGPTWPEATAATVIDTTASDHRPVVAELPWW